MNNKVYLFYYVEELSEGVIPRGIPLDNITVCSSQDNALAMARAFGGPDVELRMESRGRTTFVGRDTSANPPIRLFVAPMEVDAGIAVLTT